MTGWFLVQRLNLLHPARPYFFDRFFGTLAPFLRASERPIAIACFLLFTFMPDLPLLSVPALRFFMARPTFFAAPLGVFPLLCLLGHCNGSFDVSGAPNRNSAFGQRFIFFGQRRETRGVGMTIENKVAFGFEVDDEQPDRSVPESSKTLSC